MPNINSGSGGEEDENLLKSINIYATGNMCRGDSLYSVMTYEDVVGICDFHPL